MLLVDGRASVQFAGDRALLLRVISVCRKATYDGWIWLTGYVVDRSGQALDRREIFVHGAEAVGAAAIGATVVANLGFSELGHIVADQRSTYDDMP